MLGDRRRSLARYVLRSPFDAVVTADGLSFWLFVLITYLCFQICLAILSKVFFLYFDLGNTTSILTS